MSGTLHVRGGFADPSIQDMMSPGLRTRIAAAEAELQREAAAEQRARAERAEAFEEASLRAAIVAAIERGEDMNPRKMRGEHVGRTHGETLAQFSAQQDREDQWREARQRAAWRKLQAEFEEQNYGDTSAPTELELSERAEQDAKRDRQLVQRGLVIQRHQTVQSARRLARQDRLEDRLLGR